MINTDVDRREMDALVAEKVMGLENVRRVRNTMTAFTIEREWLDVGDYYYLPQKTTAIIRLPDYSTDIAAAWQVVEKFIQDNDTKLFDELAKHPPLEGMSGRSAALTICYAALRVKTQ